MSCFSLVLVNGREVRCDQDAGHAADGSSVFAYHCGAPARRVPPNDAKRESPQHRYSWTADEHGTDIGGRLYDSRKDDAPKVDVLTLEMFAEVPNG